MKFTYNQKTKERLDKYLQTQLAISRSQIKKIILATSNNSSKYFFSSALAPTRNSAIVMTDR